MKFKVILTAIKEYEVDPGDFGCDSDFELLQIVLKEDILDNPESFINNLDTELRVNIL